MTQNTSYSGSMSNDKRDANDSPSSNEIRADIDQTRSAVGEKIDKLQARLDPSKLKEQAQETVQEMISDTASSMTEYVRTHRDDMVSSLANAARRNPLPAALVGLGVGWLILESISGGKSQEDDERYQYERRYYTPRRSRGRYEARYQGGMYRGGEEFSGNEWSRSDYPDASMLDDEYVNYTPSSYPVDTETQNRGGNGKHQSNPLAKAAGAVKETMSDVTGEIKDRVSDVGQELKEKAGEVKDRVGNMSEEMRNRMGDTRERMDSTMGDMRYQAQYMGERGQRSLSRAEGQMNEWQRRARYEGQRRGQQVMRNLEDNPLTYGALALAAGAALAILLPQTRTENRVFGEARDQIMERGGEVLETAKVHAQQVASEVRPELEQTARKLVSDVKEAGKEVAQQAKEDLKPAVDKALEKTKEEARNVAQEVGVNPDKLTAGKPEGNKMVINKDTLRGQWNQVKGDIKSKWGQLNDDELTRIGGDYEKLVGSLQSRYGYERARAEQEVNDFFKSKA